MLVLDGDPNNVDEEELEDFWGSNDENAVQDALSGFHLDGGAGSLQRDGWRQVQQGCKNVILSELYHPRSSHAFR